MIERDYLMRMVQQLAAVVARSFKLKEQEQYDQAEQEIEKAFGELLGMDAHLVNLFDPATLAQLVGDTEKVKVLSTLVFEQGELHRLQGEDEQAQKEYLRALELLLEVRLQRGTGSIADLQQVQALLQRIDVNQVSERYRSALPASPEQSTA